MTHGLFWICQHLPTPNPSSVLVLDLLVCAATALMSDSEKETLRNRLQHAIIELKKARYYLHAHREAEDDDVYKWTRDILQRVSRDTAEAADAMTSRQINSDEAG